MTNPLPPAPASQRPATVNSVPTPAQPYLRRGAVYAWLDRAGIEHAEFNKLVGAGAIERITLREGGRGYYLAAAIDEQLIKPFREAEQRLRARLAPKSFQPSS